MKSLRSQLRLNYLAVSLLAIFLVVTVFLINQYEQNAEDDFFAIDLEQVNDNYLNKGLSYAFNDPSFTEYDAIEILDENLTVIDAINSPNEIGYAYTRSDLNALVNLSEDYTYILWNIENSDGHLMLLHLAPLDIYYDTLLIVSAVALVIFILAIYLLSLYTGKKIINPINQLTKGVAALESGNLEAPIRFKANNELVILRDAFNNLSHKLTKEIKRREQVEENRNMLIRNISHDIKTPLTNIIGYSQTLLTEPDLSEETIANANQTILKNGITASNLVSELFDLSKLDLDIHTIKMAEADIVELFRLKIIDYIPEFELKNINYNIDIPNTKIKLPINAFQLTRALDNLIQNSIKYNRENFCLDFKLSENQNNVTLMITDNGTGIPIEYAEKIFEPTVRVDASRHTEGSGLGLAISKKIIEAHHGEIYLDTHYKDGCRFVIQLYKSGAAN